MLPALLAGYLFLLIFRPYEYWPWLGSYRIERVYMIIFMILVMFSAKKKWFQSPINVCVAIFVADLLVSGVFALKGDAAWFFIQDYLKYVVFYIIVILVINDKVDMQTVLLAMLGVMILYVGKSAWEFFVNGRYEYTMGIKRMVGVDQTYGAPNSFAATICYSLPLLWAMIRHNIDNKVLKIALWGYGALAVVAIIFTGSRSGMMTLVLFLLLAGVSSSRKIVGLLVVCVCLFVGWDFVPEDLQTRFISTVEKGHAPASADNSAAGRLAGFLQGVDVFMKYPLMGIGPANFPYGWPGIAKGFNAHNLYGQILGELGIFGVLTFGALVLMVYRTNRKNVILMRKMFPVPVDAKGKTSRHLATEIVPKALDVSIDGRNSKQGFMASLQAPLTDKMRSVTFLVLIATSVNQTLILMLFKGWGDHNLYRYTWLWLAAITILCDYLMRQEVVKNGNS